MLYANPMSDVEEGFGEEEAAGDDEVEFEIGNDDVSPSFSIDLVPEADPARLRFEAIVNTYNAYMYTSQATLYGGDQIKLRLSSSFLPYSTRVIYRLTGDVLLDVALILKEYNWKERPLLVEIAHPEQGRHYLGETLVDKRSREFFAPSYCPRREYRAETFLFPPSTGVEPAEGHVRTLQTEGFERDRICIALSLFKNDISESREFLVNGILPAGRHTRVIPDYATCPLLYFMLELAECFIDLADHCFLCGNETVSGIKPTICDRPQCTFQSTSIGLGSDVWRELHDDPAVGDLVLSLFSCSIGTTFLNPSPPGFGDEEMLKIVQELPSVQAMVNENTDDRMLAHRIGMRSFELVRWVLFSNRSHLTSLPERMRLTAYPGTIQFMTIISSPEAESRFNIIRQKYGSMFLWHGSGAERWHAILRKGLKNATGTHLQVNGAALGEGIYFARASSTSLGYVRPGQNRYQATSLPRQLSVIALCEVGKIGADCTMSLPWRSPDGQRSFRQDSGFLKDHGWAHTLSVEEACVVRFLMICGGANFNVDVIENPPRGMPTPKMVLQMRLNQ
jgi:poly [ADP-ribose] polymerase 6/8